MGNLNAKPDPKATGNGQEDQDHHEAEGWSYKPARKARRDRLISLAAQNISGLPRTIEPRGQVEEVLDRVSIGRGAPVGLFRVQGDPHGRGFVSQVPPRFHELRHRYGFNFGNRQDNEKSWWWIVLNDTGTGPKMNEVPFAPEKTGTPAKTTKTTAKTPVETPPQPAARKKPQAPAVIGKQIDLFHETPPKPTPRGWRDPETWEATR